MKLTHVAIPLALVLPCAIAFCAGVFSTSFNTNMCYSEVLSMLSKQARLASASGKRADMETYAARIESLPNHGYESDCEEILAELKAGSGRAAHPASHDAGAR